MLRGEPKADEPCPTGRPGSPLSSLSEDQDRGRGQTARPTPGAHRPSLDYSALGQRGPLGPAPLHYGLPTARGGQAGLRGRSLIGAVCTQGSWEGATTARMCTTKTLAPGTSDEPHERARHRDLCSGQPRVLQASSAGPAPGPDRPQVSSSLEGLALSGAIRFRSRAVCCSSDALFSHSVVFPDGA